MSSFQADLQRILGRLVGCGVVCGVCFNWNSTALLGFLHYPLSCRTDVDAKSNL